MMQRLANSISLYQGDCLEILPTLDENSIDACVTDPPYHLTSIVKRFGKSNLERDDRNLQLPTNGGGGGTVSPYKRVASGFMGKQWDGGDIAFRPETWAEVYRVLKPGAHLLAFGGTRTYHRMACAIEDAGFEIRDCIQWLYGSGFPKSHDVSKGIDRAAGAERELTKAGIVERNGYGDDWDTGSSDTRPRFDCPATDAARQWQGWGTALKPANEPIVLARKPLSEKTVAANVLKWGTGAINVDGCRVESDGAHKRPFQPTNNARSVYGKQIGFQPTNAEGRWPANVIHDGSEEVVGAFPETQSGKPSGVQNVQSATFGQSRPGRILTGFGDEGSAARFFYCAKASRAERNGSKHPTVKPIDLMQYLVRLVTPKGGTVLDLFAGTGTTGEAAFREGMKAVLIEREEEYCKDVNRRIKLMLSGPDERKRESVKHKIGEKKHDIGPLFSQQD